MSKAAQLIGTVIGDYEVQEILGEGGMGVIYKAEHILIGKKVALKVLHAEFAEKPEVVERFFNEARAVNKIGHQNIIDISDYGFTDDERPYFLMELLSGRTLADELKGLTAIEQRRALHIARQIASALEASHKAGIIHRDLKPENIFLIQMGNDPDFVKILDFGIAKLQQEQNTRIGTLLGTPAYMPPEQAQGKRIDHRADLYALGVLLYEMLTGKAPFQATTVDLLLAQIVTEPVPSPREKNPDIPEALEKLILKALRKNPDQRFQSATEFLGALAQVEAEISAQSLESEAALIKPSSFRDSTTLTSMASELSAPPPSRRGIFLGGLVFVLSMVAGVFLFILLRPVPEEVPDPFPALIPMPEERPAASAPVTIEFVSIPEGATLTRGEEILGKTPYLWELLPTEEPQTIQISLDGYLTQEKTFIPNIDRSFEVSLIKEPQPTPVAESPKTPKHQRLPTKSTKNTAKQTKQENQKKHIDQVILKPKF